MKLETILIVTSILANIFIAYYVFRACKEIIRNKRIERGKLLYDYINSLTKYRDILKSYGYTADAEKIDKRIVELINQSDK